VRLPSCFAKEYGIHIGDVVMLCDRNQNMTEVRVDKKKGKVYLRDSWLEIMNFYNIDDGAWIKLTYVEPNMLLITITNRYGVEIDYPNTKFAPMIRLLIPKRTLHLNKFDCSYVHILSSDDIKYGFLVIDTALMSIVVLKKIQFF